MVYRVGDNCLYCGVCLDECPSGAIVEEDKQYVIVEEICTECGNCTELCPAEAVVEE